MWGDSYYLASAQFIWSDIPGGGGGGVVMKTSIFTARVLPWIGVQGQEPQPNHTVDKNSKKARKEMEGVKKRSSTLGLWPYCRVVDKPEILQEDSKNGMRDVWGTNNIATYTWLTRKLYKCAEKT